MQPQLGVKRLPRLRGHWSHKQRYGHKRVVVLFEDRIGHKTWPWNGLPRPPSVQYVNACCGKGGCRMQLEASDA